MAHLHLQIEFGSDFEGYAAGFIPPPPHPRLSSSSSPPSPTSSHFGQQLYMEHYADFCQEWDRLCWGGLSVGMFATPLTLSAAALSWISLLNLNRCSTM